MTHSLTHSLTHSAHSQSVFVRSFIPSFLPSFVHSFIRSFLPSFVHSFIPSFLHSFVPSFLVRSFVGFLSLSLSLSLLSLSLSLFTYFTSSLHFTLLVRSSFIPSFPSFVPSFARMNLTLTLTLVILTLAAASFTSRHTVTFAVTLRDFARPLPLSVTRPPYFHCTYVSNTIVNAIVNANVIDEDGHDNAGACTRRRTLTHVYQRMRRLPASAAVVRHLGGGEQAYASALPPWPKIVPGSVSRGQPKVGGGAYPNLANKRKYSGKRGQLGVRRLRWGWQRGRRQLFCSDNLLDRTVTAPRCQRRKHQGRRRPRSQGLQPVSMW